MDIAQESVVRGLGKTQKNYNGRQAQGLLTNAMFQVYNMQFSLKSCLMHLNYLQVLHSWK